MRLGWVRWLKSTWEVEVGLGEVVLCCFGEIELVGSELSWLC